MTTLVEAGSAAAGATLLTRYESAFAESANVRHAVAFAYGRTALQAALSALKLQAGDEVVLSPLTCKVVPLAILSAGLKPVYADIDPDTLNLDVRSLRHAITQRTRVILFQHTYGISAGSQEAARLAQEQHLHFIEDCAQCLPSSHGARPFQGSVLIFSNNLRKPLAAAGGGFAATNDPNLARHMQSFRDSLPEESVVARAYLRLEVLLHRWLLTPSRYWFFYGLSTRYVSRPNLASLQEEIETQVTSSLRRPSAFRQKQGLAWLQRVGEVSDHSRRCCEDYATALKNQHAKLVPAAAQEKTLYYFPIRVAAKKRLLAEAARRRIELIAWPVWSPIFPVETVAECQPLGYAPGSCPRAEQVAAELLGLPTQGQITPSHRAQAALLIRELES